MEEPCNMSPERKILGKSWKRNEFNLHLGSFRAELNIVCIQPIVAISF